MNRNPWLVPIGVSCAFGLLGVLGLYTVGRVPSMGPGVNLAMIGMSMVFSGLGTRQLQAPTAFSMASVDHHDAWGHAHYGPSRPATAKEGRTNGAVSVAVAVLMVLIGIFIGRVVP
jgi:hypothetical protein